MRSACSAATPAQLNDADLLVGQTLAHIASVAILQEHAADALDRDAANCVRH